MASSTEIRVLRRLLERRLVILDGFFAAPWNRCQDQAPRAECVRHGQAARVQFQGLIDVRQRQIGLPHIIVDFGQKSVRRAEVRVEGFGMQRRRQRLAIFAHQSSAMARIAHPCGWSGAALIVRSANSSARRSCVILLPKLDVMTSMWATR